MEQYRILYLSLISGDMAFPRPVLSPYITSGLSLDMILLNAAVATSNWYWPSSMMYLIFLPLIPPSSLAIISASSRPALMLTPAKANRPVMGWTAATSTTSCRKSRPDQNRPGENRQGQTSTHFSSHEFVLLSPDMRNRFNRHTGPLARLLVRRGVFAQVSRQ